MPSPSFILRTSTSLLIVFFFFNDTATTEIYTLSLHDALPISDQYTHDSSATVRNRKCLLQNRDCFFGLDRKSTRLNSSHANISYAVFCLKKKKKLARSLRRWSGARQRPRIPKR